MKRILAIGLIGAGGLLFGQAAFGQSCTGFSGGISGASGTVSGNSCEGSSTLANACSNAEPMNGAGVAIYEVTVGGPPNSYTINVTSSNFTPWLGYIAGTCSSNTVCIDDVSGAGGPATISTAAHTEADTPPGTYYLIIGDVDVDSPGCGDFTVTWGANLPVKLQKFSVN